MEWKELQNFKQIQIITCNDHNDTAQWWNGDRVRSRNKNNGRENVLVFYVSSILLTHASRRSSLEACGKWVGRLPHSPRAKLLMADIRFMVELISWLRKLGNDQELFEKTQFSSWSAHVHTEKCYINITCFK